MFPGGHFPDGNYPSGHFPQGFQVLHDGSSSGKLIEKPKYDDDDDIMLIVSSFIAILRK